LERKLWTFGGASDYREKKRLNMGMEVLGGGTDSESKGDTSKIGEKSTQKSMETTEESWRKEVQVGRVARKGDSLWRILKEGGGLQGRRGEPSRRRKEVPQKGEQDSKNDIPGQKRLFSAGAGWVS